MFKSGETRFRLRRHCSEVDIVLSHAPARKYTTRDPSFVEDTAGRTEN